MRGALSLIALLGACRSTPPFAPTQFVEPDECTANTDCGVGRECLRFEGFNGAQSRHCVVSCVGPQLACPTGSVCIRREYDGETGPYCARQASVRKGGPAFAGATGWDEALWVDDGGTLPPGCVPGHLARASEGPPDGCIDVAHPDGGSTSEEPPRADGCNRDRDCSAGRLCSCFRKECSLRVLSSEGGRALGTLGQCFSREVAGGDRMLKRR